MTQHQGGPPHGLPDPAKQGIQQALTHINDAISRLTANPHGDHTQALQALQQAVARLQQLIAGP